MGAILQTVEEEAGAIVMITSADPVQIRREIMDVIDFAPDVERYLKDEGFITVVERPTTEDRIRL
jgi:hypothetical protein